MSAAEKEELPKLPKCPKCAGEPLYVMTETFDGFRTTHEVLCQPCKIKSGEYNSAADAFYAWIAIALK